MNDTALGERRAFITRREYDEWVNEAAALALALNYPVQPEMVNEGTGIVFGASQYAAFEKGLWSREAYEVMIILESLNEAAINGLPAGASAYAEYGGVCDKLMIVHPGMFCPPHFHPRKSETYEVVLGEMEVFYDAEPVDWQANALVNTPMPQGSAWPDDVRLPEGREESYAKLTSFARLRRGEAKFIMHRQHLHAFRCPPESRVPLVVREISTYSHEPTEAVGGKIAPLPEWATINDNVFISESANVGRLAINIRD